MKNSPSELLNAQVSVLGSMLLDETVIAPTLTLVADSDFIEPRYRMIYLAIKRLFSNSGRVDAVTVNGALGNTYGDLLCQIMEVTPTSANWEAYAEQLKSQALLYHLQEIGNQLAVAVDPDGGRDLIDKANKLLVGRTGIKRMTMKEGFANFFDRHDGSTPPVFIRWGMSFLDQRIYAERGDMIVLGGYPSEGKTALALCFAYYIAAGRRVGYYTYEGSREKLHDRIIAAQALLNLQRIKRNELTEEDAKDLLSLQPKLTENQLELIEASKMTVLDIQADAQAHHFDVVFVDYLQKIPAERGQRNASDFERVSAVSSDLQQFGRSTGTVVVALSQLSRPEKRKDGTVPAPTMSNLRQSGQIEQDADVVLLLYSELQNKADSPRVFQIAKNKEGERMNAKRLHFDGEHQVFSVLSDFVEPPKPQARSGQIRIDELTDTRTATEVDRIFPPDKEGA
ncbi:DnaB-like helicase C-terminal domain-containing protein [Oscillibacter sp.]|uniref:replicative DNA helicase n=1 Tax=Oscillibacter sp. TaxID=1945593 RepID=UPI00339B80B6